MENLDKKSGIDDLSQLEEINLAPQKKKTTFKDASNSCKKDETMQPPNHSHLPNFDKPPDQHSTLQHNNCSLASLRGLALRICDSQAFCVSIVVSHLIFLSCCLCQDEAKHEQVTAIAEYLELACLLAFSFFFGTRLVKWEGQNNVWLVLDLLTIMTGFAGFAIASPTISRYFKAIRTFRLLFLIKQIEFLNKPASDLMNALKKVGKIMIPALVIIYVYAVIGLYTFSDFEYNKCRHKQNLSKASDWTVYTGEISLCGQKTCPIVAGEQFECINPIDYGVEPNPQQLVNMVQGNGLMQFSNIFYALLSTFKQTFVTGSSRLIVLYKQVLNSTFIEIYFYSYIYLMQIIILFSSYIYLNIIYSLIITSEWELNQSQQLQLEGAPKGSRHQINQEERQNQQSKLNAKDMNTCRDIDENDSFHKKPIQNLQHRTLIVGGRRDKQNMGLFSQEAQPKRERGKTDFCQLKKQQEQTGFMYETHAQLTLKNSKTYNIFQSMQNSVDVFRKCSSVVLCDQNEQQIVGDSLSSQFPESYKIYEIVNNITILLCCINLSLDFHGQSPSFKFVVDCIDFGFYCLLLVQISIKVLLERYLLRKLELTTKLEIGIVIICTAGIIYQAITATSLVGFFSCTDIVSGTLRSFKYLRIMVLILRSTIFKEARLILQSTFRSLFIIRHMVIVWTIIVFTFAVVGFHLHSYKTKYNKTTGKLDLQTGVGFQISFDGIFESTLFTLLTFYNEEWDYLMFQQYLGGGSLLVIWQLISILVGLLIFSKYFMALLMKQIDNLIDESLNTGLLRELDIQVSQISKEQLTASKTSNPNKILPLDKILENQKKIVKFENQKVNFNIKKKPSKVQECVNQNNAIENVRQNKESQIQCLIRKSINILSAIIDHKSYKITFGLFILSSCVTLSCTHPHADPETTQTKAFAILNIINKAFFLIDLLFNLTVHGVFQQENAYLRRSWLNCLNILILILEIIALPIIPHAEIFTKLEKIQVFRSLYFVEFRYKLNWNMRITYHSFVQLLPKVMTLLIIMLIMYSYFALVLVKLYKDDFYVCRNSYSQSHIVDAEGCMLWGGDWVQQTINVGNLLNSTLYLFYVATMEGWISLLYPMMDLAGQGMNPVTDANKYISIFFVFFFFFGNLIMLNVFIGLSVSNFKRLKDKTTGESKLNKEEKEWLNIKTQIYGLHPKILHSKPAFCIRGYAYCVANFRYYKAIQGFFFFGFLIAMSLFTSKMSEDKKYILKCVHYFFIAILILEYLIQLLAFGVRTQYKRTFIFKNVVVVYAILFVAIQETTYMTKETNRIFGGIFIALQFIRYLALLDEIPFAKKLLNTILSIIPQTSNILLLICLTLFIYSIIGMELFAFLRPNIELDAFNQNYTNFSSAMFALIKFSTLESPIQQISDAAQSASPDFLCTPIYTYAEYLVSGQNGCGNAAMSYIFFLSFHILYSMLLMSTIMAVIVDIYSQVKREQEGHITKYVLDKIKNQWALIDPEATGYIPYRQFWMFTSRLLEIYMGSKADNKMQISTLFSSKQDLLSQMAIPIYQNQDGVLCFQFNEVIQALTRIYITRRNSNKNFSQKAQKMFKERESFAVTGFKKSFYTSSHVATLIILKSGLRMWKKLSTNEAGRMEYKNVISKFNKGKQKTGRIVQQ